MSEKIKHTPGPWRWADWTTPFGEFEPTDPKHRTTLESFDADPLVARRRMPGDNPVHVAALEEEIDRDDQILLGLALTAPHDCDDPQCPGVINKERLELLTDAIGALRITEDVLLDFKSTARTAELTSVISHMLSRAKELQIEVKP